MFTRWVLCVPVPYIVFQCTYRKKEKPRAWAWMHLQSQLSLHPPTCTFHTQTIKVLHFLHFIQRKKNLIHPGHVLLAHREDLRCHGNHLWLPIVWTRPRGGQGGGGPAWCQGNADERFAEWRGEDSFILIELLDDFFPPPCFLWALTPPGETVYPCPRKAKRISRSQVMQGAHRHHHHPDHPPPSTPLHTYSEIYRCINCAARVRKCRTRCSQNGYWDCFWCKYISADNHLTLIFDVNGVSAAWGGQRCLQTLWAANNGKPPLCSWLTDMQFWTDTGLNTNVSSFLPRPSVLERSTMSVCWKWRGHLVCLLHSMCTVNCKSFPQLREDTFALKADLSSHCVGRYQRWHEI